MTQFLKLVVLTIVIFTCSTTTTQAQKTRAKLVYKDGKVVKGIGNLVSKNRIRFRTSKKERTKKLELSLFDRVYIYNAAETQVYTEIAIKGKKKKKVVEIMAEGDKLTLYRIAQVGVSTGPMVGAGGGPMMMHSYTVKNFYVKRAGETEASHLGSNQLFTKNFKKAASEYFKDCPSLVKKIKEKEFKKRDLKVIVDYYNEDCK